MKILDLRFKNLDKKTPRKFFRGAFVKIKKRFLNKKKLFKRC